MNGVWRYNNTGAGVGRGGSCVSATLASGSSPPRHHRKRCCENNAGGGGQQVSLEVSMLRRASEAAAARQWMGVTESGRGRVCKTARSMTRRPPPEQQVWVCLACSETAPRGRRAQRHTVSPALVGSHMPATAVRLLGPRPCGHLCIMSWSVRVSLSPGSQRAVVGRARHTHTHTLCFSHS